MEIKIAVALERWGRRYGSSRKSQENFLSRRVWVHLLKLSKYTLENDLISPSEFRSVKKKIHQREKTKHKDIQLCCNRRQVHRLEETVGLGALSRGRQTLDSAHVTDSPAEVTSTDFVV